MTMQAKLSGTFADILNDRYRVVYHILFWLAVYIDEIFSGLGISTGPYDPPGLILGGIALDMILVYVVLYVFLPWLFEGKTKQFFFASVSLLFLTAGLTVWLFEFSPWAVCTECSPVTFAEIFSYFISTSMLTGLVLGSACGLKILKEFYRNEQKMAELVKSNLENELAYLKEQINPHFLFNALNNIYVQSRKHPKEAPESILLLSDLLRYQLYDSSHKEVFLEDEIKYLRNYLELDRMRRSDVKTEFKVEGSTVGIRVAPYLFIPFLENAVKHGIDAEKPGFLEIKFDIQSDSLTFTVKNSKAESKHNKLAGGIGLTNIKRRLELLYPERHSYNVNETDEAYEVSLKLVL